MSETAGGQRQHGRRTFLKGLVATGLTASLAGCTINVGSYESSISAYAPDWARDAGYTSADHRRHERNLNGGSGGDGSVSVSYQGSFVSHAVTYAEDQPEDPTTEPRRAVGTFTTPTGSDVLRQFNPFVDQSIDDLLQGDAARLLLDGLGINVGANWSWESGPTVESLDADSVSLYDQSPDDYALAHGVVRTANVSRAVLIVAGQRERGREADDEIILTGLSMQQVVEQGTGSADFRSEHGDQLIETFASSVGTVDEIDPDTDLADFD